MSLKIRNKYWEDIEAKLELAKNFYEHRERERDSLGNKNPEAWISRLENNISSERRRRSGGKLRNWYTSEPDVT